MYTAKYSQLNSTQQMLFKEMRRQIEAGKLPAALINPALIAMHNQGSPQVAQITEADNPINIDALLAIFLSDGSRARVLFYDTVRDTIKPTKEDPIPEVDMSNMSRADRRLHAGYTDDNQS